MKIRNLALAALVLAGAGSSTVRTGAIHRYNYENILGTSLEVKILAANEAQADRARDAALDEIERLRRILSGYDAASEFSRWAKTSGAPVRVSPELREVLGLFDEWRAKTDGALDPAAETITRVWAAAAAQKRMPTADELSAAVSAAGRRHWEIDAANGTATHLTDAPLVLNSLAKSYIAGRSADTAMRVEGVRGAVVNIGGDLVVRGEIRERVDIADPRSDAENAAPIASISIKDRAIATSGDYRRGFAIGGARYSHIVDPRTGRTAQDVISSTVAAPDAATAGALATAFSVLKPAEATRIAANLKGVDYLIVGANGRRYASAAFMPAAAATSAASATWDASMELTVSLELAQIGGFGARRPYLAAWIEDADKFPVKTLALWYEKPRWLPELKAWYKDDRLRAMAEGTEIARSVSSATRSAGKYTLKWDGKDNAGKPVKPGRYTVLIEAAREHGTYQLIRQEMQFDGAPKQAQGQGGTEIAAASFDYHKTR